MPKNRWKPQHKPVHEPAEEPRGSGDLAPAWFKDGTVHEEAVERGTVSLGLALSLDRFQSVLPESRTARIRFAEPQAEPPPPADMEGALAAVRGDLDFLPFSLVFADRRSERTRRIRAERERQVVKEVEDKVSPTRSLTMWPTGTMRAPWGDGAAAGKQRRAEDAAEDAAEEESLDEVKRKARVQKAMFQRHSRLLRSAVVTVQRVWRGFNERNRIDKDLGIRGKFMDLVVASERTRRTLANKSVTLALNSPSESDDSGGEGGPAPLMPVRTRIGAVMDHRAWNVGQALLNSRRPHAAKRGTAATERQRFRNKTDGRPVIAMHPPSPSGSAVEAPSPQQLQPWERDSIWDRAKPPIQNALKKLSKELPAKRSPKVGGKNPESDLEEMRRSLHERQNLWRLQQSEALAAKAVTQELLQVYRAATDEVGRQEAEQRASALSRARSSFTELDAVEREYDRRRSSREPTPPLSTEELGDYEEEDFEEAESEDEAAELQALAQPVLRAAYARVDAAEAAGADFLLLCYDLAAQAAAPDGPKPPGRRPWRGVE